MESIFLELANTSSRLEKEAILKKHHTNETLKRVLFLALDPYTQFYIRKIPVYTPNLTERFATPLAGGLDNLDKIINRDVTGNAAIQHLKNILESVLAMMPR